MHLFHCSNKTQENTTVCVNDQFFLTSVRSGTGWFSLRKEGGLTDISMTLFGPVQIGLKLADTPLKSVQAAQTLESVSCAAAQFQMEQSCLIESQFEGI